MPLAATRKALPSSTLHREEPHKIVKSVPRRARAPRRPTSRDSRSLRCPERSECADRRRDADRPQRLPSPISRVSVNTVLFPGNATLEISGVGRMSMSLGGPGKCYLRCRDIERYPDGGRMSQMGQKRKCPGSRGAISLSSARHLPAVVGSMMAKPVALPPGRAKLPTKPLPTGSATMTKMTGMV